NVSISQISQLSHRLRFQKDDAGYEGKPLEDVATALQHRRPLSISRRHRKQRKARTQEKLVALQHELGENG
ncbi:hypothetical protein FRC00_003017, partial [Tulasnella sp. 408]